MLKNPEPSSRHLTAISFPGFLIRIPAAMAFLPKSTTLFGANFRHARSIAISEYCHDSS
jgi:hypothetical protein